MRARRAILSLLLVLAAALPGCIRRTIEIDSQPQGAIVYLNDEEVGRTPTEVPFTWYGNYDVRLAKQGYQTLNTTRELKAPVGEWPGPDLFVEIMPWTTHYRYQWNFELAEQAEASEEGLIDRGQQLRSLLDKPVQQLPAD